MINRQIQVRLVKPSRVADEDQTEKTPIDIEKINEAVADQVFNAGVVVVGGVCAVKVVSTICTIAINLTNPANWR